MGLCHHLDDIAVNLFVTVQEVYRGKKFLFRGVGGEMIDGGNEPHAFALFLDAAYVADRRPVIASNDCSKMRCT